MVLYLTQDISLCPTHLLLKPSCQYLALSSALYIHRNSNVKYSHISLSVIRYNDHFENHLLSQPPLLRPFHLYTHHVFPTSPPNSSRYPPSSLFPPNITKPSRKTHCPPPPRRTQSLLRKRTHLPLLAEFQRRSRRSLHRPPKLRRFDRPYKRRTIHVGGYGVDGICAGDISLESEEYKDERTGWVR